MKAVRLAGHGRDPVVAEVAEPAVTGPLDVIVKIAGAGLCRTDLHMIEAASGAASPRTLGHENAGWIAEVGPGVAHLAVGDPVIVHPLITCGFCLPCRRGDDMGCASSQFSGGSADGGMAELLKTTARSVIRLPAGLEPADVAAHADAGLTAYHAVKKALPRLSPGTTAVVLGAGGLGHIGIQCLLAMSAARVIAVDPSEPALQLAREVGAHEAVLADGTQAKTVGELTGGAGAEVMLDFVGEGGAERDAQAMLGRRGVHFVVGYGGALEELPTVGFVATEKSIVGCQVGTYIDLVELMSLAASGLVTVHNRMYPLDAVGDAIADLRAGRLRGRGILVP